jgi:outer membrane usher protein
MYLALGAAWAQSAAVPEGAIAELFVDGESRGNVDFFLDSSSKPLLPASLLRQALTGLARPEIVLALGPDERLLKPDEVATLGLGLEYDPDELKLSLSVPPRLRLPVDIGNDLGAAQAPGEVFVQNARFVAALGLDLSLAPGYASETDAGSLGAQVELSPSLRAFDLVAEGDATIGYEGGPTAALYSARLVRDFPEIFARSSLGIVDTKAEGFQVPQELLGVLFGTEASMEPQPNSKSIVDEFVLEREADVTVEVNGTPIRRLRLSAGSYRISDLPLASGMNEVDVLIEEDGQEPRRVRLGIPFDSAILEPGQADYSIGLGAVRSDPTEPMASLYFSMGAAQGLQFGIDAQACYAIGMGGLSAVWASSAGTLGAEAALSFPLASSAGASPAGAAQLYWRFSRPGKRYIPQAGAAIELQGAGFTAPRGDLAINPAPTVASWDFSAQATENLPWGGCLTAVGDLGLEGGWASGESLSIGISIPIRSLATISLSGGFDWSVADGFAPRAAILLSLTTPGRLTIQSKQDLLDYQDSIDVAKDLGDSGLDKLTMSADNLFAPSQDGDATAGGRLTTRYANFAASGGYYRTASAGFYELQAGLDASTSLVFADGVGGATSSLGDSSAIVVPSPAVGKESIALRCNDGSTSSVYGGGTLVVPSLTPYQDIVASVEMPDSPPETRPSLASVEFKPAYRSATLLRIGVASSISVRGRLVGPDGRPRRDLSGRVLDSSGTVLPDAGTFSDDDGVFECYDMRTGPATIEWSDGSASSLEVPEGESGTIIELGDLSSSPAGGGAQ